ncbi:aminotransferase class III-fold pyridoxal phosphate-dependent enzyme, partial [Bacillus sp. GbtcB15]
QFTSEPAEKLAVKLNELLNADEDYWSFFVNSGSEATETAMKIAIQHWQEQGHFKKNKILSRWVSYHGITLGALSMSGHVSRRERFVS